MEFVVVLALFVALAVLGPLFGADSRDGLDWRPATQGLLAMTRRTMPDRPRRRLWGRTPRHARQGPVDPSCC